MNDFLKKFYSPGRFFQVLGYVSAYIGLLIVLLGLIFLSSNAYGGGEMAVVYSL